MANKDFQQFHLQPIETFGLEDYLTSSGGGVSLTKGAFQSPNYVKGQKGWKLDAEGHIYSVDIELTGGTIKYNKTSFTDSANKGYHISSAGFYFGSAANASYIKYNIDTADFTLHGVNVSSPTLTNLQSGSEIAIQGWQQDMTFSSTDADTVSWTSGTITLLDGTTYNISAGNTGNMSAITYIYLDIGTSLTVLQTSTTATDAVGSGKILVGVAQNNSDTASDATYQIFGGKGGEMLGVDNIAANSASVNEFVSNTAQIKDAIITKLKVVDEIIIGLESNLPSDENLVGYWAFDEGAGSKAYDGSGEGNDGTLTNMEEADWVDGVSGSALNFDGSNEYVDCGDSASLRPTDISIRALFYIASGVKVQDKRLVLISKNYNEYEIVIDNLGGESAEKLNMYKSDGAGGWENLVYDYSFSEETWYDVAITFDSSTKETKFYINGELKSTQTFGSSSLTQGVTEELFIGARNDSGASLYWEGKIDEPRIYDAVLTHKEIYALYKNPSGQPSLAIPMGRLTSGSIFSKQITLAVAAGTGDSYIAGGNNLDLANWRGGDGSGGAFILGLDDSIANDPARFFIGNYSTKDYLSYDSVNKLKLVASGADALEIAYGSDILLTHGGDIKFTSVTCPTACVGALAGAAGNVDDGTHKYAVTYVNATGETELGAISNTVTVADKTVDGQVSLTSIPTSSSSSITSRKIYRTKAGGSSYYLLTTIANNTGTTYTDNTADGSLGITRYSTSPNDTFGTLIIDDKIVLKCASTNTLVGQRALESLVSGFTNTAIGASALRDLVDGYANTAVGKFSMLYNISGKYNVTVGEQAGYGIKGDNNVAIGCAAMVGNPYITGEYNIGIGALSLTYLTSGNENIGIGKSAGQGTSLVGNYNIFIGTGSGSHIVSGSSNVFLGYKSGYDETGSDKLFIDNADRGSEANGRVKALIYGVFDAATANQKLTINGLLRLSETKTPASSGAAGSAGDIAWDASYIYVCTATNNWERAAIATW